MSEASKAIARRYYSEIMNLGNHATIDELIATDFILTNPSYPASGSGPQMMKQRVDRFRQTFGNPYFNLESLMIEGDTVVVQWTCQGSHTGEMPGSPATHKPFKLSGTTWLEIKDGKVQSTYINEDALGMYMQLGIIPGAPESPAATAATESNKAIVQRYFSEIMSQGKLDVIDQLMAENFVIRIAGLHDPFRGPEGMKQFVTGLRTAFPDIHFTVEHLIAEGDKVAARFTSISTHQAEFAGVPATGKSVQDQGTDIFHIVDGKIIEVLVTENALGVLQQIGAIPVI